MKDRTEEIEMLLKAGRVALKMLHEDPKQRDAFRGVFEAIRAQNTTLRTEIQIQKLMGDKRAKA